MKRFNIYSQLGNKLRQELDQAFVIIFILERIRHHVKGLSSYRSL